jgi:DNA-binding IclR family transcriptional regulator
VATETAQTLDRGLRLLSLVAQSPAGVSPTEAAQQLEVGRAVIYRLAGTLIEHGLIRRDASGRLRLGAGVLQLARRAQPLLAEASLPALRRLADEVGATAHLTLAEGPEAVAAVVVEPTWTQFHVAYRTGSRHPLDRGAAGRAIVAGSLAATSGELESGAHGVAVPILGVEGLAASVGVVSLTPLDVDAVAPHIERAAAAIAHALS